MAFSKRHDNERNSWKATGAEWADVCLRARLGTFKVQQCVGEQAQGYVALVHDTWGRWGRAKRVLLTKEHIFTLVILL